MNATNARVIALAAICAVAGCATASNGSATAPNADPGSGSIQPASNVVHHSHAPDRLAKRLINAAVAPPGAVPSPHTPTKLLSTPPDRPIGHGVIVRIRWWRIDKPWHAAYSWVVHHQAHFLTDQSGGAIGGTKLRDNEKYADFTPGHLPASVNSATLTIAVQPLTEHTSAISAYALVVRQPPRPADENVPHSVEKVALVGQHIMPGQKTVTTRRTVTGSTARRLVSDFDQLVVQPDEGATPCPIALDTQTATFQAGGKTWVVHNGFCDSVTVTLNNHRLPALEATGRFTDDLNAALAGGSTSDIQPNGDLGTQVREPMVRNTPIR